VLSHVVSPQGLEKAWLHILHVLSSGSRLEDKKCTSKVYVGTMTGHATVNVQIWFSKDRKIERGEEYLE
jgi:hypothetical protein